MFGGITSLNDVIIPKLKALFTLSYGEVMLVQSAFFAAYFLISIPAAGVVRRFGYMRTAVIGLLTMTAGCLLFWPAAASGTFPVFLIALFVLATGITVVQVVANPLISLLGPPRSAHSRLTFAQAFNSLGTTVFPYFGSIVILGGLASVDPKTLQGAALTAYPRGRDASGGQGLSRPGPGDPPRGGRGLATGARPRSRQSAAAGRARWPLSACSSGRASPSGPCASSSTSAPRSRSAP